jgi:hypothetical protein
VSASAPLCFCCRTVAGQLGLPLVPLVALAEYRTGDPRHRRLRGYKDSPVAEERARHRARLAAELARWADDGTAAGGGRPGGWAVVTTVPSSRRPGPAPVEELVDAVPALAARHLRLLVRGAVASRHLAADRRSFALAPGVDRGGLADLPVLVIDDTTTTGAAAQSAAAALRLAGARVAGIVVLGRALAPVDPTTAGARPRRSGASDGV